MDILSPQDFFAARSGLDEEAAQETAKNILDIVWKTNISQEHPTVCIVVRSCEKLKDMPDRVITAAVTILQEAGWAASYSDLGDFGDNRILEITAKDVVW
jgi:hypothetical protein